MQQLTDATAKVAAGHQQLVDHARAQGREHHPHGHHRPPQVTILPPAPRPRP